MSRAGLSELQTKQCSFCGFSHDNSAHMWTCPVFESVRPYVRTVVSDCLDRGKELLPCETLAGVFLQDPELIDYFNDQVLNAAPKALPIAPDNLDPVEASFHFELEGEVWVLGGTDGSCVSPRHPLLARAGSGVYFFEGHPCNHWDHSPGFPQTAQRGEVFALLLLLRLAFANTVAVVDSAYVCVLVSMSWSLAVGFSARQSLAGLTRISGYPLLIMFGSPPLSFKLFGPRAMPRPKILTPERSGRILIS